MITINHQCKKDLHIQLIQVITINHQYKRDLHIQLIQVLLFTSTALIQIDKNIFLLLTHLLGAIISKFIIVQRSHITNSITYFNDFNAKLHFCPISKTVSCSSEWLNRCVSYYLIFCDYFFLNMNCILNI